MEFTTFLRELDAALADLPPEETARIREFYSELYFDAVENGGTTGFLGRTSGI